MIVELPGGSPPEPERERRLANPSGLTPSARARHRNRIALISAAMEDYLRGGEQGEGRSATISQEINGLWVLSHPQAGESLRRIVEDMQPTASELKEAWHAAEAAIQADPQR